MVGAAGKNAVFFDGYVEETLDPGWSLIVGSLVACAILFASLPCLVSLGSRYERKQYDKHFCQTESTEEEDRDDSAEDDKCGDGATSRCRPTFRDLGPTKISRQSKTKSGKRRVETRTDNAGFEHQLGQQSSQGKGYVTASSFRRRNDAVTRMTAIHEGENITGPRTSLEYADGNEIDHQLINSLVSTTTFGDGAVDRICESVGTNNHSRTHFSNRKTASKVSTSSRRKKCGKKKTKNRKKDRMDDETTTHSMQPKNEAQQSAIKQTDKKGQASFDDSRASSLPRSIMSRLHHDDVSFTEAVDNYRAPSFYRLPTDEEGSGDVNALFGKHAWWRPKTIMAAFDGLVGISDFDDEMMVLVKSSLPSSFQGFWTGAFNLLDVSLVGLLLGTEEASVFVIVSLLTWLPTTFNYGFCEALAKLVPAALEQDESKVAGMYLNTCMSLYTLGMIVVGLIWSLLTQQTFLWLGFDNETACLAQQYAYIQVALEWVTGIGYCIHLFLDVTGHERYSTFANMAFGIGQTSGILLASFFGQDNLVYVGLCRFMFAAFHVLASSLIVVNLGWVDGYCNGILSIPLKDRLAVKSVASLAGSLGVAFFLSYGAWEFLILFARALGSAEVVSWAMLGYIWSMLKSISDGIADAAESRCALHLVSDQPQLARLSLCKSTFLGLVASITTTSLLFIMGDAMTEWITQDATLQGLLIENFPLIGLGNIVHSIGIVCASILGAQGRSGLATSVQSMGNWCITLPLSGIFTYGLRIDLQGLTSAVVLGLAMSGAGNAYILMRSEWDSLASILSQGFSFEEDPNE